MHNTPFSPHSSEFSRREFSRLIMAGVASLGLSGSVSAMGRKPSPPPLGCQTELRNAPAVAAAGGSFIGLSVAGWLDPDGPEENFLSKLSQAASSPLPIMVCNSFIRRKDLHCNGPEANHDDVFEYCVRAFKRAQRAGVTKITFGSSGSRRIPENYDYNRAIEQFVTLLKRLGPAAQDHGVTVGVEQLNKEECNFITRIAEVEQVVRATDHPNVRGIADFYHMAKMGDTTEQLASAADILSHVEIAEVEGRRMPGVNGQDFRPWFKALKDSGYMGAIGVEGKWSVSELPMGFKTLTRQWNEA